MILWGFLYLILYSHNNTKNLHLVYLGLKFINQNYFFTPDLIDLFIAETIIYHPYKIFYKYKNRVHK